MATNIDPFYSDPTAGAQSYLSSIPDTVSQYYNPYIKAGKFSLADTMGQYLRLTANPAGMLNKFSSSYTTSPSYDWDYSQGVNAANEAASAGGMLGTPQNQEEAAQAGEHAADQDYWNYINHVQGLYSQGLSGLQHTSDVGYKASSSLADTLAKTLMSEAGLSYLGAANQNQANAGFLSSVISGVSSLF